MAKWKDTPLPDPQPPPEQLPVAEGTELPPDLREPSPKVVPLERLPPEGKHDRPPDVPPVAPLADPAGPLPRLIHQNERAVAGTRRFKIRCDDWPNSPVRYILVADKGADHGEAVARQKYLESIGLDRRVKQLEAHRLFAAGGDKEKAQKVDPPYLVVTALSD